MESKVGPFGIESLLGEGAIGRVYRARHEGSGEEVALKVLWPHHREQLRSLVLREVDAVARLDHPGVVWVHDFGEDPAEGPWVALELLTGGALLDRLPLQGWSPFADLAQGLLAALAHAHAREVLHRDLKPGNVLLGSADDPRPGPKLVDFGLAAVGRGGGIRGATPDYAPPEQREGALGDEGPWTDLYALGATLWHAACGAAPSRRPAFSPAFPVAPGLEEWLRWLLSPAITERPANAARALAAFRELGRPPEDGGASGSGRTFDDAPDQARSLRPHPRRSPASLRLFGLRPVPLAGRSAEQQELVRWVRGEGPPVCLVTGPAGIGKSHLLRWLAVHLRERDLAWVVPIGLHRAAPVVRGLQDAHVPGLEVPASDAEALRTLVRWASTADRPVVVLVDTVEGRPGGPALVSRLTGVPGLRVLTTSRSAPTSPGHSGAPDPRKVVRLGNVDPAALVRAIGVAEAELPAQLAQRTGGHPGHTVRMVADLVRGGRLVPGHRGYTLAEGATLSFPEGPLEAARAAVRHLPPAPALGVAAVLGAAVDQDVWRGVLARLGVASDPTAEGEWVRAGAVRRTARRLHFDDPLVRAVLEEDLPEAARRGIAGAAADETADRPELAADHAEWAFAAGRHADAAWKLWHAGYAFRHPWDQDRGWFLLDLAEQAAGALEPAAAADLRAEVARMRAALLAQLGEPALGLALLDGLTDVPEARGPRVAFLAAQLELWLGRPRRADERLAGVPPDLFAAYWAVRARVALEAGRDDDAAAHLARAGDTVEAANEAGMLAVLRRDPEALARALADGRARRIPGSMWPEQITALGAVLGLLEAPLPAAVDDAIAEASRQRLPYVHAIVSAAAVLWAARSAPDELVPRLAAATEAIATSGARFRVVHELLLEAAALAPPGRRAAVLDLAATQVPRDDG